MPAAEIPNQPANPYLLLTPGPLSTTPTVKATMLRDWCTWDDDYKALVQDIRTQLVELAAPTAPDTYTAVLMQGSGTFSVEAAITTAVPAGGTLLVLINGAYGRRIAEIAGRAGISLVELDCGELAAADPAAVEAALQRHPAVSHVAVVHCETTTGLLNPIEEIGAVVKRCGRDYMVDAMSSFGGIPLDQEQLQADFLISSANKCIQGVPGFGFVIARRSAMEQLAGRARSLSLDLYDQWRVMERAQGKWRYTSPTHVVRAFAQALAELRQEGGIPARYRRYRTNQELLAAGMADLGFRTLLDPGLQSPIITAFFNPEHPEYRFDRFYQLLKQQGYVIYPGKVSDHDTFRIGTIGDIHPSDVTRLLEAIETSRYWKEAS